VTFWNSLLVLLGVRAPARSGAAAAPWARAAGDPPGGGEAGGKSGPGGPDAPGGKGDDGNDGAPGRESRGPQKEAEEESGRQRARLRLPDPRGGRRGPQIPIGPAQKPMRTLALWLFILLVAVIGAQMYFTQRTTPVDVSYTRFIDEIRRGNIKTLTISEGQVSGELKKGSTLSVAGRDVPFTRFRTFIVGQGENLPEKVWAADSTVEIVSKPAATNWWAVFGTWVLPLVVIVALWLFIFRQMQSGGSAALKFGKSRAKVQIETSPKVTFKDVAGCEEAKQELQEIIEFLQDPQKFVRLGGRIPKGALLLGPPGTGKTLLAKAVAGEAGVPFFSMSGSDFVEMFVGVGASVTGDTPILVRENGRVRLLEIAEFVDRYYQDDQEGYVVPVRGVQTLGFAEKDSKFTGSPKRFLRGSRWTPFRGVYRHRVTEICEIRFLGGTLRTTGDHSVFVRSRNGIRAVAARDLQPGDVLVNLPFRVRGAFLPGIGTPHDVRAHEFPVSAGALSVEVVPRDEVAAEKYAAAVALQGTMSQAAIGALIGVSQATVGHWQSGQHEPRAISANYTDTRLPTRVGVTPQLLKLFGYYTAEGRDNGCLQFVFGSHESDLHADCMALMSQVFGLSPRVEQTPDHSTRITYYSAPLGRFFSRQCGKGSRNKRVPEMLWEMPREYFDAYLTGYALGDGYVTREGKLSVTSVSRRLIRELRWLCAMHGIKAGVRRMRLKPGRVLKQRPLPATEAWNLIIGRTSSPFAASGEIDIPDQGKKPVVREIVVRPFDGYVYDLCGCENEAFFGGEAPVLLHNSRVRDLFDQGKRHAPCILFIDEIDAVGRHRGAGLGGGHDEREQTLNQLLVEMDGFDSNEGVILIAATNRPDVLDPALLRPGRFDRHIVVDWPDLKGREGILRVHTRKIPLAADVNLEIIARGTPGMAGADLANLVNEAALLGARRNRNKVTMQDFEDAKDKVMLGTERRSLVLSEEQKKRTAYHEGGHALVSWLQPGSDPVHKVTIVPRGRALGLTASLPSEERYALSRAECERRLVGMLGGRAADKLVFNELTTGAASDIEQATNLARKMVCEWGMSEMLGPLTFGKAEETVFLGREIATHKDYSESTAQLIDKEIRGLVEGAYDRALGLLSENRDKLELLAAALLEREALDGDELGRLLRGETLPPVGRLTDAEKDKAATEPAPDGATARAAAAPGGMVPTPATGGTAGGGTAGPA
jgi:ATP-dependent metalloprotease FtsH